MIVQKMMRTDVIRTLVTGHQKLGDNKFDTKCKSTQKLLLMHQKPKTKLLNIGN